MVEVKDVDVRLLDPPPKKMHPDPDPKYLYELAESIKAVGQLQEIIVRPVGDRFQVIVGWMRTQAAKIHGIPTLRAKVETMNDRDALLACASENIQRLAHDPLTEAEIFADLVTKENMSDKEVADKFGKSASYVSNRILLLRLNETVQDMLKQKRITLGAAQEIAKLPVSSDQTLVAASFIREPVTVDRAKAICRDFQEYKKAMKDAPVEKVLDVAREEPRIKCEACGNMVNLSKARGRICCDSCWTEAIYLREKDRREREDKEGPGA